MADFSSAYSSMMQPAPQPSATFMGYETCSGFSPSLPDDVFFKCLLRVPLQWHANLQQVSRSLRSLIQSADYYEQRKREGTSSTLVCMLQPSQSGTAAISDTVKSSSNAAVLQYDNPVYGVSVLDVQQQLWERLPPVPGLPGGLPTFSKLVALNGKLLVLGGWLQSTWEPSRSVFVYNFSSQSWRRGADMPSVRSLFACGAANGKVYIAGGHDVQKEALTSADVYDIETDCWSRLPCMQEERDECAGVMVGCKFYAISGYKTVGQGVFAKSAEVYDPVRNSWTCIADFWPFESSSDSASEVANPGSTLAAMSGHVYTLQGQEVFAYSCEKNTWTAVDKVPEGDKKGDLTPASITSTGMSLLVTGLTKKDGVQTSKALQYVAGHGSHKAQWQALTSNDRFLQVVQASCAIDL